MNTDLLLQALDLASKNHGISQLITIAVSNAAKGDTTDAAILLDGLTRSPSWYVHVPHAEPLLEEVAAFLRKMLDTPVETNDVAAGQASDLPISEDDPEIVAARTAARKIDDPANDPDEVKYENLQQLESSYRFMDDRTRSICKALASHGRIWEALHYHSNIVDIDNGYSDQYTTLAIHMAENMMCHVTQQNQQTTTAFFELNKYSFLLSLRNMVMMKLQQRPARMLTLLTDNDFQAVLNKLDPEKPIAVTDLEDALRHFDLGMRMVDLPDSMPANHEELYAWDRPYTNTDYEENDARAYPDDDEAAGQASD